MYVHCYIHMCAYTCTDVDLAHVLEQPLRFGVILAQIATDNCRTLQQAATGDINAVPLCEGALHTRLG